MRLVRRLPCDYEIDEAINRIFNSNNDTISLVLLQILVCADLKIPYEAIELINSIVEKKVITDTKNYLVLQIKS